MQKCIRVFPRRTKWTPIDDLAFVGDPPLFRPSEMPVKVSVTFTWDIKEGERLQRAWSHYYSDVDLGGVAFGDSGIGFTPGQFIKEGVTFTSRGCNKRCPWCFVPEREGKIRELEIKDGYIVQDNNLLACSDNHIDKVFAMLRRQKRGIVFSGGLDATLLKSWHVDLLKTISVKEMWFACDTDQSIPNLEKISELLKDFSLNSKRCYVLIGYTNNMLLDQIRLKKVLDLGFLPFAQLYQPKTPYREYPKKWRDMARVWSRPAIYKTELKKSS
jgi:hypothetical protein